jgi:hypothetical protein
MPESDHDLEWTDADGTRWAGEWKTDETRGPLPDRHGLTPRDRWALGLVLAGLLMLAGAVMAPAGAWPLAGLGLALVFAAMAVAERQP